MLVVAHWLGNGLMHGHTLGICNFFFPGGVFPTLGHIQEDNSPPPFESHGDFQTIAEQDIFRTFTKLMFSRALGEKDNTCMWLKHEHYI